MNIYIRYRHDGDILKWEFAKYSTYNCFLMSYLGWKTYFNLIYPSNALCASDMSHYYEELFEIVFDFDFKQADDVIYQSDKMAYLHQVSNLTGPSVYLSSNVAPHTAFDVKEDCVYFLKKSAQQDSKYATAYFNLGIYDAVYDDRVMVVPDCLASGILSEMQRIQKHFQYNDNFMENVCQFVVQTYAIINGIEIKTLDERDFVEPSPKLLWFLSNKTPVVRMGEL